MFFTKTYISFSAQKLNKRNTVDSSTFLGIVIAMDGGAQVFKSTVAEKIRKRLIELGLLVDKFESGLFYRSFAHFCLIHGVDPSNESALQKLVIQYTDRINLINGVITLDGVPLDADLRRVEVAAIVSKVSEHGFLRKAILPKQRLQAKVGHILVAEGRDMCTTVFPDARYKFFLYADIDTRASREYQFRLAKGEKVELASIKENLVMRDRTDSERHASPLHPAEGAVVIDTTLLTSDEVTTHVISSCVAGGLVINTAA